MDLNTNTSLVYALLAGILPSLIWLIFWLREDANPEPRLLVILLFVGGMVGVAAAIVAERYTGDIISNGQLRFTVWAAIEEGIKFLVVAVIALNTDFNDEPIDAMMYCIVAALGFSALENALFIMQPLSTGAIAQSIIEGNMRFVGATLVHIVSSACVGFGLGMAFYRGYLAKAVGLVIGLGAAISLHAAFNLSIINTSSLDTLKVFGWVWAAVVVLIVLFEEIKSVRPKTLVP
ncbi:MAG: PrsW family intramembrane metalloprotease [Patescibacteria group bacterium]|nr:PrsW family intramembrane metalloprotease [Patescibacteria group bacterium]MDE1966788.1 PrsW family intramembrane metalloprotease [Patescibacteria group bacterium]